MRTAVFLEAWEASIRLRCPVCKSSLKADEAKLICVSDQGHEFLRVDDVPILLNRDRSVFREEDFRPRARTTFKELPALALRLGRWVPSPSRDVATESSYGALARLLCKRPSGCRRVLVIGCGDGTAGYGALETCEGVEILETDVSLAGRAKLVCDASDLPFDDQQFDLVICVAVLEHVLEPQRCVDEIHRVLRLDGMVYAATPFMQQVHMGEYDFTRFTRSGHRWIFRRFIEIDSGISTGPASVLIWSIEYFLLSWTSSVAWRRIAKAVARVLFGWLTVLDLILARKVAAFDGAGGFYFVGKRSEHQVVSAREMIAYYRGADAWK